jgi:ribosome-associated translation inhibitor RaiA
MKVAVDELVEKLSRQVRDLHEKRVAGRKHFSEPENLLESETDES